MDFKKIQWVLIIAFLFFDIYLFYMLFSRINVSSTGIDIESEYSIQEELSNREIKYYDFDKVNKRDTYLMSFQNNYLAENIGQLERQNATVDTDGVLTSTFDAPVNLNININHDSTGLSDEDKIMITNNYLSDPSMFIGGNEYRSFWYVNTKRAIYIRMTDESGNPIVDGTAEIQINLDENFDMVSYVQTYQEKITPLKDIQTLISEEEAIENIDRRAETYIPDHSNIHYSIFVYYRSTALDSYNVYSPAWQFIYDNESGRYTILVDAIQGNVIGRTQVN